MALLNDEPTLIDRLDRGWLVTEVGDAIASCTPPQVFGVHGDWGLGKTSFLHQLQLYLTGDCPQQSENESGQQKKDETPSGIHKDHVKAVWFEAWRYQHDEVPVVALLQEIRSQLDWSTKLGERAAKLTEVAVRGALLSIEDAISNSVPGADETVQARRASAYLEKLCQNVWHLPAVQRSGELLCEWIGDSADATDIRKSLKAVIDELGSECLPPNPRRIKGLANLLRRMAPVLRARAQADADLDINDEARHLLVVAYVYQFHPDLYRRREASPDLYDWIRAWVRGQGSDFKFLKALELPFLIARDETTPTPRFSEKRAYPDPTESNVFWIQPLIHRMGDAVSGEDFEPYLRAKGTSPSAERD